jgi:hypothetical protein
MNIKYNGLCLERVYDHLGHQGLQSLRQSYYASFTLATLTERWPITALEITYKQTSTKDNWSGNFHVLSDSNTCIEVIHVRGETLPWSPASV